MLTKLVKIETGLDALTFTSKASSGTSINVRTIAYNVKEELLVASLLRLGFRIFEKSLQICHMIGSPVDVSNDSKY
ncbi:hypothetical protein X798_07704 [Onchocerca flexuosa]|uniref:Uncharacterized protein n=1 Tax=Onchocerca flexuosa TaxID=387005 RepID=A0A238BL66_9BILA|nr:hypothetical protein X798_07704 [Onchocerca flexuosa]